MIDYAKFRDKRIVSANQRIIREQKRHDQRIVRIQLECSHPVVAAVRAQDKYSFCKDPGPGTRKCLVCGKEEIAWSWGPNSSLDQETVSTPTTLRNPDVIWIDNPEDWAKIEYVGNWK